MGTLRVTLVVAEEDVFTDEMVGGDSTDAWRGNRASEFAFDYRITASDDLIVVLTQTDIDRRRTCPIDVVGCVEIARYWSSEWIAVHKGDRSVARLPKPPRWAVEAHEEPIGAVWEMIGADAESSGCGPNPARTGDGYAVHSLTR